MLVTKSHDVKGYVLGLILLLLSSIYIFAQCPITETVLLPLDANGRGTVQVADFLSPSTILKESSISKSTFDCRNIGIQEVTLEGILSNNVKFSCKQLVIVYDSMKICSNKIISPNAISGKIITENGIPIQNATIGFSSDDIGFFRGTNEDGLFLLDDIPANSYTINAEKNTNLKNGVSTQDILTLQKHLLKIKRIKSPYQLIAADVNNSGSVTAFDMILIRQIILNAITTFPDNQSWKFIRLDYVFQNPEDPFKEVPAASYTVNFQPTIAANNNFIGVKIGDLNHSVIANQNQSSSRSSENHTSLMLQNKTFRKGDQFSVSIKNKEAWDITGMQFALSIDPSVLSLDHISDLSSDMYHIDRSQLLVSLADSKGLHYEPLTALLTLHFTAKQSGQLGPNLQIVEGTFVNEWYDENFNQTPLNIEYQENTKSTFSILPNYPNPFINRTTLPIGLPEAGKIEISVFDTKGRKIWEKSDQLSEGMNNLKIDIPSIPSGIYFYQIHFKGHQQNGKLHVLK